MRAGQALPNELHLRRIESPRDKGSRAMEDFLAADGDGIGSRSTLDIDQLLEGV